MPMSDPLAVHHLARHGETAWSLSGQHTGLTDLPLTPVGEHHAALLGKRLRGIAHREIWTSPLQRARKTCELAGLSGNAQTDADLVEWNYGAYEGRRSAEIHVERPQWNIFRDGCPGGESPEDVLARAQRVVGRLRATSGNVIIFSSGHFLRVLGACWLGLEATAARFGILGTASLSALGYEHDASEPVIRLWNDTSHLSS
jgi:broad specificity phosphatase PhoE